MNKKYWILLLASFFLASPLYSMTMTLKKESAIVLAAFGTTTKARVTFDLIDQQVKADPVLGQQRIEWAFTSEIIRERANKAFKKRGETTRYLSLLQVLANLEAEGYRKVVVQPLHIFPGQEYEEVQRTVQAFKSLGMRIELGETLLQEWPYVFETIDILEKEFLKSSQGCNVIVVHGSPKTFVGSNTTYLGLDRYLTQKYQHVFVGGVDGILTREQALSKAKNCSQKRIRFVPYMLVAGNHIMKDIMSPKVNKKEVPSWTTEMKEAGFVVETLTTQVMGEQFYKGLGFNEKIVGMFIRFIKESLGKIE